MGGACVKEIMPSVSVVIPAYNAQHTIGDCLGALAAQQWPRTDFEVIVVDDCSSDGTAQAALAAGAHVVHHSSNRGAAAARNTGWQAARGTWVAFTDADCLPTRGWLRWLLAAVTGTRGATGAAGKSVGFDSRTPAARFCDLDGSLDAGRYLAHPRFPFAPSLNLMYRRSMLAAVGGFDERYTTYDACDLHQRIRRADGGPFLYEPRALVLHRHRERWSEFWRQQYGYGKGYGQFMLHHRRECRWTLGHELRELGTIGGLALTAWLPVRDDRQLVRRGLLVKKAAQHAGFLRVWLDARERARW
jgi:glycosyltransferase involved in cell wall biosynthesis